MKKILFMALMCMPFASHAISIGIKLTCTAPGAPAPALSVIQQACTDLESQLNTDANKDLPEANIGEFTKGFANATAVAGAGQGSDYSDKIEHFSFKPNVGIGIDTRGKELSDAKDGGAAVQVSVAAGINLKVLPVEKVGPVEFKKMDLFINYFGKSLDQDQDNLEVTGTVRAFGVHGRYELIEGQDWVPGYMAQWGGVHFTTGLQYSSMNIDGTYKIDPITENVNQSGANVTASMNNGVGKIEVDSSSLTIPLELSTYVRAAYVFTFFGGIGTDINFSKADVSFDGSGTISGSGTYNPGAIGVNISGSANVSESSNENGDKLFLRGFVGTQINLPFFRIYGQVNKVMGKNILGANIGMKIIW